MATAHDAALVLHGASSVSQWEPEVGDQTFTGLVLEHLQPVLAPRGFPGRSQGDTSVLFHCDGPDVDDVLDRYPAWREPLRKSYGGHPIPCLDLWVQQEDGARSWLFEIFDREVAAAAGPEAMQRLEDMQHAALDAWAAQLAGVLDAYFAELEADRAEPSA